MLLLLLIPAFVPSHGRPRPLTPALSVICIAAGAQFIVLRNKRFVTICTQLLCHSSLKGEFPEKSDFSAALHSAVHRLSNGAVVVVCVCLFPRTSLYHRSLLIKPRHCLSLFYS